MIGGCDIPNRQVTSVKLRSLINMHPPSSSYSFDASLLKVLGTGHLDRFCKIKHLFGNRQISGQIIVVFSSIYLRGNRSKKIKKGKNLLRFSVCFSEELIVFFGHDGCSKKTKKEKDLLRCSVCFPKLIVFFGNGDCFKKRKKRIGFAFVLRSYADKEDGSVFCQKKRH